ncbi:MAG: GGDEF domain-containing protein, partial [Dokdonella sp.]
GSADVVSRLGGEEFVVMLTHTSEAQARELAERMRRRVAESGFVVAGWPAPLRVSIGVAAPSPSAGAFDALLRAADRALYTAKRAGRNCVVGVSQIDTDSAPAPLAQVS